jgi:aspartyl-tRNA(Asn)/glutamyl-tRNA(Gln) amidotransferase subunit B
MKYETVVGLEIHSQLLTESKMFCSCSTKFGAKPNTHVCPVCTGQPGVLPVLNKKAIELAIKTALSLNCKVEKSSVFARKNYFYPDLPKAYQISQFDLPLATGGYVDIVVEGEKKRIGITRIHLEEDAGKLVHKGAGRIMGAEESLVDYNRGGTPLMEIVTEPDIRSPLEAKVFMETLQHLLQFIQVCDAKMEEGSLRCDANISLRPGGQEKFGTKTEVKNMNSFRAVQKALEAEEKRHAEVLDEGGKIIQETRFFDDVTETTIGMRSKEFAHDYRYFPEPDLVPVEPDAKWIEEIKKTIGELPEKKQKRFEEELELSPADAEFLVSYPALADYFEGCLKIYPKPKLVANWIMGDLTAYLKANNLTIEGIEVTPSQLAEMLQEIDKGTISGKIAKTILLEMLKTGKTVHDIIKEQGLTQISDESVINKIIEDVIAANPSQVAEFKAGKDPVIMFLVGQVMKASKGRAKPDKAQELLRKALA